ncbi:Beta-1,3-galactosyltransferase 1 [Anthophora plagiata]
MGIKLIFVIFCISAVFILFLAILKTDGINDTKLEFKYLHNTSYTDVNISSVTRFITEPKCESDFVVWVVTSSANNPLQRSALRHAYSNEILRSLSITRVFLLGIGKENMWKHISRESQMYNDLLQGDFLEDYRNLTIKHLMGLRWASENCKATFLIKSDDDIVLDIYKILQFLRKDILKKNAIAGYILRRMEPVRISNNKWFVTREDFPDNIYPDFLSGWFYITSLKVVQLLVSTSKQFKNFFWIDDVFITGILRQECGLELEGLNGFYATDYRYLECCIRGKKEQVQCEFIAGPDGGKKELHIKFREFSEFCQQNCSKRMRKQSVLKTCVAPYEEKINIVNSKAQVHYI